MSETTPVGNAPTSQVNTTINTQPAGKSYLLNEPIKDTVSFGNSIPKADVGKLQENLAKRLKSSFSSFDFSKSPIAKPRVQRDHRRVDVGILQANLKQK